MECRDWPSKKSFPTLRMTKWRLKLIFSSQNSSRLEITNPTWPSISSNCIQKDFTMLQWKMLLANGTSKENLRKSMARSTWKFTNLILIQKQTRWNFRFQDFSLTKHWVCFICFQRNLIVSLIHFFPRSICQRFLQPILATTLQRDDPRNKKDLGTNSSRHHQQNFWTDSVQKTSYQRLNCFKLKPPLCTLWRNIETVLKIAKPKENLNKNINFLHKYSFDFENV